MGFPIMVRIRIGVVSVLLWEASAGSPFPSPIAREKCINDLTVLHGHKADHWETDETDDHEYGTDDYMFSAAGHDAFFSEECQFVTERDVGSQLVPLWQSVQSVSSW